MRKLLSLKNVYDSTDIKSLNNLFDAIETQVCSFNDLDYILANKARRPYRFFFQTKPVTQIFTYTFYQLPFT